MQRCEECRSIIQERTDQLFQRKEAQVRPALLEEGGGERPCRSQICLRYYLDLSRGYAKE
ncbi:hypothetical protein PTKIN_Ptkin11bG0092900 [Pterospermum kingtungense]